MEAELVDVRPPRPGLEQRDRSERYLLLAMLHLDRQVDRIAAEVHPESFRNPLYAEIFSVLVERGEIGDVERLAESLSDDAGAELQRLLTAGAELDPPGRIVADSLAQLRYLDLTDQIAEIDRQMRAAAGERRAALEQERLRLVGERKALGIRGNWAGKLGT